MTDSIVICDDEPDNVATWAAELAAKHLVPKGLEIVPSHDFRDDVGELEERRTAARASKARDKVKTIFDSAAVLAVDFDLIGVDEDQYLTGENVAYLARCYSDCDLIVGLNQFGMNPFDLTLRGHAESFADLDIGSDQLANPALWGFGTTGFRPWAWPVLPELRKRNERRVKHLIDGGLDQRIAEVLGLTPEMLEALPRSAREFVDVRVPLEELTFREYATAEGGALRRKDKLAGDEAIARVAAARIAKWCECWLLPEQDLLVDAPHLAQRYPSLVEADPISAEALNIVTDRREGHQWKPKQPFVDEYLFPAADWLSRSAWFGKSISGCSELPEVRDPWSITKTNLVFCEDLSRFLPREAAREFVAELESPYVRRFVSDPSAPALASIADELSRVVYKPLVRLSL